MFAVYGIAYYIDMKNTPDLYECLFTLPGNLSGSLGKDQRCAASLNCTRTILMC